MNMSKRKHRMISLILAAALVLPGLIIFREVIYESFRLMLTAGIIALVLSPIARMFERWMKPAFAAALALVSAIAGILLILIAVMIPLVNGAAKIYSMLPGIMDRFIPNSAYMADLSAMLPESGLLSEFGSYIKILTSGAASFAGAVADIFIAVVIAWHLMVNRTRIALQAELFIPSRYREVILRHAAELRLELGMYLRGQSVIAVCVGILSAAGLSIARTPYAVPLGFTAGVLNMIPYLGPVIACIPVGLISLSEGVFPAVIGICVLIAVQQIDGLILSPRIVGNSTGFSPVTVMVAIFASGAVWGIVGMLTALPALNLIRTCVRVFVELRHND